jgi:putative ABC transport system substrate-binding protein
LRTCGAGGDRPKLPNAAHKGEGNVTGVSTQQTITAAHRLELLHQLMPAERSIAFLVNPTNPSFAAAETKEVESAANVLGVDVVVLSASSTAEIEAAFLTLVKRRAGALLPPPGRLSTMNWPNRSDSP